MDRVLVNIKGIVQGVGFRPWVFGLAGRLALTGYVKNTSAGVVAEIEGDTEDISSFVDLLRSEPPPLARISQIDITPLDGLAGYRDFSIVESADTGAFTLISPDMTTCPDCVREMLDPSDRRYLYPFINCVNCGPRYTITLATPYDRERTTMKDFKMCPDCRAEYSEPADRRFHAEPNACPVCGPMVELNGGSEALMGSEALVRTIELLKEGAIVAIKGLGGYHLAVDAENSGAVKDLRNRKRKSNKPFALMAPHVEAISRYAHINTEDSMLLKSPERPIVLLKKTPGGLAEAVSPNNDRLGFMLPYTPLHHLLFCHPLASGGGLEENPHFNALVMTSGNISEEPIVAENMEAAEKLGRLADYFLSHNRPIFTRVDDSVIKPLGGAVPFIHARRSRGYAPMPIELPGEGPDVLGAGADLKNTFTLTRGGCAIISQHIGDMENLETLEFYKRTLQGLKSVYRAEPVVIAYDPHPGYMSTKWALSQKGPALAPVQHHYAHIGSVMAEHGLTRKVIGVAFDGTGYGPGGELWGGEFLVCSIDGYKRYGALAGVPLPGGEQAIRNPWKTAVSYVREIAGDEAIKYLDRLGFIDKYGRQNVENVLNVAARSEFSPLSSGAGRLFDAVSALIGVCDENTYEGEAAIALEALVDDDVLDDYPVNLITEHSMFEPDMSFAVLLMLNDIADGLKPEVVSSKFHNTMIKVIITVTRKIRNLMEIDDVALSGGVFQNSFLLMRSVEELSKDMNVYFNVKVPPNDGGVSLGQAYIARQRLTGND